MKPALVAFAVRFSALAFQLVDGPFYDRLIGEEWFDEFFYLVREEIERLAAFAEFLLILYAQYTYSIQISIKIASEI